MTETSFATAEPSAPNRRVWRIEVRAKADADDPRGAALADEICEAGLGEMLQTVSVTDVFLIETTLDQQAIERIAGDLLIDPVVQVYRLGAQPRAAQQACVEVHYKPGVMDPVAQSTELAIADVLGLDHAERPAAVRTAKRYDLAGIETPQAMHIAQRLLANPVIQDIKDMPEWPQSFPQAHPYALQLTHVPIRELDDDALMKLSREAHLFLSLDEMRAIRTHYQQRGAEPTDIELETLAQTWSEHCVHKTLKALVRYAESDAGIMPSIADWADRPGHRVEEDGTLVIDNLLKHTIAAATQTLIDQGIDWCVSVFVDNAGIIRFDETHGISFKVETHNHPSAIEPYGGAATGIGGCIRDTMGTGLAATPIASTDIFAVADPTWRYDDLPAGVLHPKRVLRQVVAGVRDYGNRMGIPTVNGAVIFDDRYLGNPLVFAGNVGLIPLEHSHGEPQPGDHIIALGGRTGRDGIHGATFSSAELTDSHAEEFAHAVQIGNAITQKMMLDVIVEARDAADGPLFNAITDCGAGGFSSAIGEMGETLGAEVYLDRAPLKYQGLSYTEIWISEAQERMVLSVPADKLSQLKALCETEDVLWCDLGTFGTDNAQLRLHYSGEQVGQLDMEFLHHGLPRPQREARWNGPTARNTASITLRSVSHDLTHDALLPQMLQRLLSHPNIASKHWVVRQYDHEVQGGSIVRPLVGPTQNGPGDAAVVRPKLDSDQAVAIGCGLCPALGAFDPYWMALAAVDEAVRNVICVGGNPDRVALLDNFCWPGCDDPENLGALVRACEGCYDAALAYRAPFISGKDSLNNQFTTDTGQTIEIAYTLLISAMAVVEQADRAMTMHAKAAGQRLIQVGATHAAMGATHLASMMSDLGDTHDIARVDLTSASHVARTVAALIADGKVAAAHDPSEGGMLVAAVEMAMAGELGLEVDLSGVPHPEPLDDVAACFAETPSRYLLAVSDDHFDAVARALTHAEIPFGQVGRFTQSPKLRIRPTQSPAIDECEMEPLRQAWYTPLDW